MSSSETARSGEPTEGDDGLEAIRDLPPSAKLVAKVLEYDGTLAQSELIEETMLPPRTVRYALGRLEEQGVLEVQFSFADARKRFYALDVD